MNFKILIVVVYLIGTLIVGLLFRKRSGRSNDDFFLAGRGVGSLLLFFTIAATNFSAFTMFGFSGAGYRMGYSFYPVMGFGTGFMALSMYIIGKRILILSRRNNYITPTDFILDRYGSPLLKKMVSIVMIVFTLPYIALQAIASGNSLTALTGIPYLGGALLVTVFVIVYVTLGGLRSIVWTDFVQGLMMIGFTLAAFFIIARGSGGFLANHRQVQAEFPAHFFRPGTGGPMVPGVWFGFMFLWFFSVPLSPHIFQRFLAAKDEESLKRTAVWYPIITTFLFFLTVSIGVMGRGVFPGLSPSESDTIFPLLLQQFSSIFLSTLLLTGSLAALMSTMDSQLLTLTSLVTLDFMKIRKNPVRRERIVVIILGAIGFLIAVNPPETILGFISGTTFNGLSVLAPVIIGGLFWKRGNGFGAMASIAAGEVLVVLYYLKRIPSPGLHPVVPIVAASAAVYIVVSLLTKDRRNNDSIVFPIEKGAMRTAGVFVIILAAGHDFWRWGKSPSLLLGLPLWVWYFFALGILLSVGYRLLLKSGKQAILTPDGER